MKICTICKDEKRLDEFYKRKGTKDGKQYYCIPCGRDKRKLNYANDPTQKTRYNLQTIERKNKYKRKIYNYLLEHPCIDCGESDPIVIDFDHVRGEKRIEVAKMVAQGFSWEVIEEEIAKCDPRCSNCHRRKTAKERNYYTWLNST